MKVKVDHEDVESKVEVKEGTRVEKVLEKVNINPETVIVEMEGKIVSLEEELEGGEKLKLVNVVSGG